MSIFHEPAQLHLGPEQQSDIVLQLISDLLCEATNNFLYSLIAAGKQNGEEVWQRFHEGFAIDADINMLTTFHLLSGLADNERYRITQ